MSFNPSRLLNEDNTKMREVGEYLDFSRYKNFKKINIDYTIASNNTALVSGPVFNSNKIVRGDKIVAYSNPQVEYTPDEMNNSSFTKEYNKIR